MTFTDEQKRLILDWMFDVADVYPPLGVAPPDELSYAPLARRIGLTRAPHTLSGLCVSLPGFLPV